MKKILVSFFVLFCALVLCACKMSDGVSVKEDNGLYIIKLSKSVMLEPFVVKGLKTNKDVFDENNFILSMNAGYFDTINKQTTSYVVIDGETVLDPTENQNLINNPKLKANMDKILNRSELRYLACSKGNKYVIQRHLDEVEEGCKIVNSIQAGPQLLPDMDLQDEYFVSKNETGKIVRDPIRVGHKIARIAVGLDKKNCLFVYVATNSHPMNLVNMAQYMKNNGIISAINFDGGGSVSLNYKNTDIFSDYKNTRRQVKSFLVVKKY